MSRRRSWWGWGWDDEQLDAASLIGLGDLLVQRFDLEPPTPIEVPDPASLELPRPRVSLPDDLGVEVEQDPAERVRHGHGQAFRDVVRALAGEPSALPDVIAYPASAAAVERLLAWATGRGIDVVPYGGGTSVVGGVETPDRGRPVIVLDLARMDRVLEVDRVSRSARIQAGAAGPQIEDQLRPHDLTLRHFPQSWEFSTLGGWLATRAGGHYATLHTHIDDLTESISAVTPAGPWVSRRLPGSGAGPSPDRLWLGSEGVFGVVTEAWMRVQRRPRFRSSTTVSFADLPTGARAVRVLAQSGLYPANCRLLDPVEAALSGAGDGDEAILVLGFESDDHPLEPAMGRALELCRDHGGRPGEPEHRTGDESGTATGGASRWRETFLRAPYLRDGLVRLGMVVETVETSVTWDAFDGFVDAVRSTLEETTREVCGQAVVSVRLTHAYPNGAAPYFTVIGPGRSGSRVSQWDTVKAAVSDAILAAGGTITHHHAIGRDHVPWYVEQRPALMGGVLGAAKEVFDPGGIMNPGVLGLR